MKTKQKLYWAAQLFGWFSYILLVGGLNKLNGNELNQPLILNLLFIFLLGIGLSHLYRNIIIALKWAKLNIGYIIGRVILASLIFAIIFHFTQSLFSDVIVAKNTYSFELVDAIPKIINWTLLLILWSSLYFLFHFINNYKQEEIKNLRWQAAKNEIELNKIKSQLNPHFIFNSMNSIRALIDENPLLAKSAITQLSNVLRNSLLMGKKKLITFGEELQLVDDYLNLEKTRFEERLKIEKNIAINVKNILVPPLMIQTLVENGIKHGTSKQPKGGTIKIDAIIKNNALVITIENTGYYDKNKQSETGFGVVNTIQRLNLIYGDAAKFTIKNTEHKTVEATLIIPQNIQQ